MTRTAPSKVAPRQIWKSNDQRTKGTGEFRVLGFSDHGWRILLDDELTKEKKEKVRKMIGNHNSRVIVERENGRLYRISQSRLLTDRSNRGYTYIGMGQ